MYEKCYFVNEANKKICLWAIAQFPALGLIVTSLYLFWSRLISLSLPFLVFSHADDTTILIKYLDNSNINDFYVLFQKKIPQVYQNTYNTFFF